MHQLLPQQIISSAGRDRYYWYDCTKGAVRQQFAAAIAEDSTGKISIFKPVPVAAQPGVAVRLGWRTLP